MAEVGSETGEVAKGKKSAAELDEAYEQLFGPQSRPEEAAERAVESLLDSFGNQTLQDALWGTTSALGEHVYEVMEDVGRSVSEVPNHASPMGSSNAELLEAIGGPQSFDGALYDVADGYGGLDRHTGPFDGHSSLDAQRLSVQARLEGRTGTFREGANGTDIAPAAEGAARSNLVGARPDVSHVLGDEGVLMRPSAEGTDWEYEAASAEAWRDVVGEGMPDLQGAEAVSAFRLAAKDHTLRQLDASERGLDDQLADPGRGFVAMKRVAEFDAETHRLKSLGHLTGDELHRLGELDRLRQAEYNRYPLLQMMWSSEMATLSSDRDAFEVRLGELGPEVRGHIDSTRDRVAASGDDWFANEFDPMAYPHLVKGTADDLGITTDHPAYEQIMSAANSAWWGDVGPRGALAVGGVALGVAGLVTPTPDGEVAGAGMTLAALGMTLTGAELAMEMGRYEAENAAAHVGLGDPRTALLPYEDPTFRTAMLALGGVGGLADVAAMGKVARARHLRNLYGEDAEAIGRGIDAYNAGRASAIGDATEMEAFREGRRLEAEMVFMPDGTTVRVADGASPRTLPDGSVELPTDYTSAQALHEGAHALQQFEARFPAEHAIRKAAKDRIDAGVPFSKFSDAEKTQLHQAVAVHEVDALNVEISAYAHLLRHADDPAESARIEASLAAALENRGLARERLDRLGDPKAPRPDDFHVYPEDLEFPKGKDTSYQRFVAMGDEGQQLAKQSIADELSKGANEPQDWEVLARLGYRHDPDTGVVARPVGLTDELPAVQFVDGRYVAAITARANIKYGAALGKAVEHGTILDGTRGLSGELHHNTKQVDRIRSRLALDPEAELTVDHLVKAREQAQGAKSLHRLDVSDQETLSALSKRPVGLLTPAETRQLESLQRRQAAYSKAAGDMIAASEILGEEAAAQVMRNKNPGKMKLLQSGHGANTYDQIWMDTSSGRVFFVEGKGGSAVNSSARKMPDGFHAQQGSAEYHKDLWGARSKDVDAEIGRLEEQLRTASEASRPGIQEQITGIEAWYEPIRQAIKKQNHEYLMVSQKLDGNGLGRAVEREFTTGPDVLK